jgi:hypothetical protein
MPATPGSSSTQARAAGRGDRAEEEARLAEAAEHIVAVTGCDVPCGSAGEFASALADGVLLCAVVNSAFPGAVPEVSRPSPPRRIDRSPGRARRGARWRRGRRAPPAARVRRQLPPRGV